MTSKLLFALSLIFSGISVGICKEISLAEMKRLQASVQSQKRLHVDVKQSRYLALRKRFTETKGEAFFEKPNKFRWITDEPNQHWIFDGSRLFRLSPDKGQALKFSSLDGPGKQLHDLVDMVLSFDKLLASYQFVAAEQLGDYAHVSLKPKAKNNLKMVDLKISLKQKFVEEAKLSFDGDSHTVFAFSNPRYENFPKGTFTLPSKTKVKNF